jgi:uncharacterized membrane protein YqjE
MSLRAKVHDDSTGTEPKRAEASLGDLFGELTRELTALFRQEVQLARTEATKEVGRMGRAAAMFGTAGVAGLLALSMLSMALAWLLDQAINRALAFAIVGAVWAIAAVVLVARARREAKDVEVLPVTKQTLKEDVEWARAQRS